MTVLSKGFIKSDHSGARLTFRSSLFLLFNLVSCVPSGKSKDFAQQINVYKKN